MGRDKLGGSGKVESVVVVTGYNQFQGGVELAEVGETETKFGKGGGVGDVACVDDDVDGGGGNGEWEGVLGAGADVSVGEEEEAGGDCW